MSFLNEHPTGLVQDNLITAFNPFGAGEVVEIAFIFIGNLNATIRQIEIQDDSGTILHSLRLPALTVVQIKEPFTTTNGINIPLATLGVNVQVTIVYFEH